MTDPIVRLVEVRGHWEVCRIAMLQELPDEYSLPDDPTVTYEAWVYGTSNEVLCRVGQETATYPLPTWEPTNFFSDRFPFAIITKSDHSEYVEKVGGCNNAVSARSAFETQIHCESPHTTVLLRHGARVLLEPVRGFVFGSPCIECEHDVQADS